MNTISEQELTAAREAFIASQNKTNEPSGEQNNQQQQNVVVDENKESPAVENKTEESKKEEPAQEQKQPVVVDENKQSEQAPAVKEKTIDEIIAEKTGGKISKWDDIEKILNTPKEEIDEDVKHWNELKKKGIKLDKEFFELQELDLGKLDDPDDVGAFDDPRDVIFEAMRRKPENKSLSNETIRTLINRKYNLSEWEDKDDSELTVDDKVNRDLLMRDGSVDLAWLKNYKSERLFSKPVDPAIIARQQEEQRIQKENFERYIDNDLFNKVKNVSIVTDEKTKEVFDYKFSETERKEIASLMKSFASDGQALFNRYAEKDAHGNLFMNQERFFLDLIKAKTYDDAVRLAYNDGKAVGAKTFVEKDLKNIDFKQNEQQLNMTAPKTEAEAIAQALKKSGQKLI